MADSSFFSLSLLKKGTMPTAVKEDYLKALYYLNEEDSKINLTELSNKLGVSKPTANSLF